MRVLLVGGGGREHALAWKLAQNPTVDEIYRGARQRGHRGRRRVLRGRLRRRRGRCRDLAERSRIDLIVVGPEAPLVDGPGGRARGPRNRVFGPTAEAALIEGSKAWAKEILRLGRRSRRRASETFTDVADAAGATSIGLEPPYRGEGRRPRRRQGRRGRRDARRGGRGGRATASSTRRSATPVRRVRDRGVPRRRGVSVLCLTDGRTRAAARSGAGLQARGRRRLRARTPAAWARTAGPVVHEPTCTAIAVRGLRARRPGRWSAGASRYKGVLYAG